MISYLRGKVILALQGFLILDVSGVGYKVNVSARTIIDPNLGEAEFFIYNHIREDSNDLYGFATFEELDFFEKLITVNGVGPRMAMVIMNGAKVEEIAAAVANGNVAFFKSIPGIGTKVAAKIILELKNKLSAATGSEVISSLEEANQIIEALQTLGYRPAEINKILSLLPGDLIEIEDKVRWCIKNLAKANQ